MLGICESCGYRGWGVMYELTTEHELCLRCYDKQIIDWAFRGDRTNYKFQHPPKAA